MKYTTVFGKDAKPQIGYKKQSPNQHFFCLGIVEFYYSRDTGRWGIAIGIPYIFAFGVVV